MSTTVQPDASWYEIDPAFYTHGGSCFSEAESLALSDCTGEKALVTPASGGEEALSLVNLGASVSVLAYLGLLRVPARAVFAASR